MHSIIRSTPCTRRSRSTESASTTSFRQPHYDSELEDNGLNLSVYLPGVQATGIEITTHGPDLTIMARKFRTVRPNWNALQLERLSADYRLNLRLGRGLDLDRLHAEFLDGTLTLRLPQKASLVTSAAPSPCAAA